MLNGTINVEVYTQSKVTFKNVTNNDGQVRFLFPQDKWTHLTVTFEERLDLANTTFDFSKIREVEFKTSLQRQWFPNVTFWEEFRIRSGSEIYILGALKASGDQTYESKIVINTDRLIFGP